MSDENQHPDPYPHAGGEPEANPAATPSADMADTAHQANRERDRTTVAIDLIEFGHRIRALDHDQVMALKESIALSGLINPLLVYRRSITRDGQAVDGFGLIAGAHRLAAFQALGLTEVEVTVVDMDALHRTIAECDENLCGTQLSQAERARFTKHRKLAYERLHPETKHGGDRRSDQVAKIATRSFAVETAASTGKAPRTVRLDCERGDSISDTALAKVARTKFDNGVYLDRLKKLPPEEQEQRVDADLAGLEGRGPKAASRASRGKLDQVSKASKNPGSRPTTLPANPAARFAVLVEKLTEFSPPQIEGWRDGDHAEAIAHARCYAHSASRLVEYFRKIHGDR
jgi:ParB-like chromosome segregation protein Spo0J